MHTKTNTNTNTLIFIMITFDLPNSPDHYFNYHFAISVMN